MCNYNQQPEQRKEFLHLFMQKAAQNVGGINFLLSLLEAMKMKKPHALLAKECKVESTSVEIQWNKIIFKDKFDVLENIILVHKTSEGDDFNLLEEENHKKRKKILNMVKTLLPIEFIVKPKNPEDGNGFSFKIFETIEDDKVTLNPVFLAFFFCSVEFSKKSLKYKESLAI